MVVVVFAVTKKSPSPSGPPEKGASRRRSSKNKKAFQPCVKAHPRNTSFAFFWSSQSSYGEPKDEKRREEQGVGERGGEGGGGRGCGG